MSENDLEYLKTLSIEELQSKYCQPLDSIVPESVTEVGPHVTSLILYPVKGCMAFPVKLWPTHEAGLFLDRHWCIKSTTTGKYLNIAKRKDSIVIRPFVDLLEQILILAAPGMDVNCLVPILDDEFKSNEQSEVSSLIIDGGTQTNSFGDCGDEAAHWINEALDKTDCRLLRQFKLRENNLSLACDSHIQLLNITSLQNLAEAIAEEQGFLSTSLSELCLRFRPNVVVAGLKDNEEARLEELSISGVRIKCGELVERCKAVNIDLQRYDYEVYPLKYLVKSGHGKAYFGLHSFMVDCNDNEVLKVDDKITIHKYKD